MAEDQTPPDIPATHHVQPAWVRYVILTTVFLILIILVYWSGGLRTEGVRRDTFGRGVDALSGSLAQALIERNDSKLQSTLQRIAAASGFDKVTVTDEAGLVQASTDRVMAGKVIEELKAGPMKSLVSNKGGHLVAHRAIVLAGDTRVGGLEVVASP